MPPELFLAVLERLAHTALGLFAQATVVAGLTLLALRTTARRNPAVRHAVALAAVICLISSPALASGLEAPANASGWPGQGLWPLIALFGLSVWLAGCAWLLTRWISACRAALHLRQGSTPLDAALHADALDATRETLGVRSLPPILISPRVREPLALGPWRPAVLLPAFLLERLTPQELRDVLVHECAHLRQRHHLSALAGTLAGMLFWPHPLVRGVCRELADAREEVCDNFVLRGGNAARYARTLLTLAEARIGTEERVVVALPSALQTGLNPTRLWCARVRGPRRSGALRRRVEGLLDRGRPRDTRCGRQQAPILAFTCGALVISMTGVGMAANQPTAPSKDASAAVVSAEKRVWAGEPGNGGTVRQRNDLLRHPVAGIGRGER